MPVSIGRHAAQPLITVAITCYEAEDTIVRAVESALAQTWFPAGDPRRLTTARQTGQ